METNTQNKEQANVPQDRNRWTYSDWVKNDPKGLLHMKATSPLRYKHLKVGGLPEDICGDDNWTHLEWLKRAPATLAWIRDNDPARYQTILKKRK